MVHLCPTAIRLVHAHVREVIAQNAQVMSNTVAASPLVSEKFITKAMKELAETMDDKLNTLTNNINLNTDIRIKASTDTLKLHATNIHNIMSAMAMEFQQLNHRIHNIMQTLVVTSPYPPHANTTRLQHAPHNFTANTHTGDNNILPQIAPPGFNSGHYRNSPSTYHKGPNHPHE